MVHKKSCVINIQRNWMTQSRKVYSFVNEKNWFSFRSKYGTIGERKWFFVRCGNPAGKSPRSLTFTRYSPFDLPLHSWVSLVQNTQNIAYHWCDIHMFSFDFSNDRHEEFQRNIFTNEYLKKNCISSLRMNLHFQNQKWIISITIITLA